MVEFIGIGLALFVGIIMGLTGAGGSILTVPILVYILDIDPIIATSYSLLIVGATSFMGSLNFLKKGLVEIRTAIIFAIPALFSVFITRKFILPAIPDHILNIGVLNVSKDLFIMVLFAALMIVSALSMIQKRKGENEAENVGKVKLNYGLILVEGIVVGLLTGLVGAGGGFLIVPALVLFGKLPIKIAAATSLTIIAMNSFVGVMGDISNGAEFDWFLISIFSSLTIVGVFIGIYISGFINGRKLRPLFGYFVLLLSFYIIYKEIISNAAIIH